VLLVREPADDRAQEGPEHLCTDVRQYRDDAHGHALAEFSRAVRDESERDGGVQVRTRGVRDRDTGEDGEAPAEVHHQESAVVALVLRQCDVGDDATAEQHEHGRADEFREEHDSEIVHVDLP
jgi:hypothetical protein